MTKHKTQLLLSHTSVVVVVVAAAAAAAAAAAVFIIHSVLFMCFNSVIPAITWA